MLATTLGACWGKAVLDVISLVRFATPTVGVVPGCAALGTVATLWWARQTAQGGKVVRMLQVNFPSQGYRVGDRSDMRSSSPQNSKCSMPGVCSRHFHISGPQPCIREQLMFLQIMILWTLWMGIATGTMMYLASGRVIIEALELEDMQRLGTSHCIMALGVVILMFFTRRLLADEVGCAMLSAASVCKAPVSKCK